MGARIGAGRRGLIVVVERPEVATFVAAAAGVPAVGAAEQAADHRAEGRGDHLAKGVHPSR